MYPQQPVLLVTETPPGTPNGFGVTLKCIFKDITHKVIFTDSAFQKFGQKSGFLLAQVPQHRSKKYLLNYLIGRIPEWRGYYSGIWLKYKVRSNFSFVYAFVYSVECMKFAQWISKSKSLPLAIHVADHSVEFERPEAIEILKETETIICITDEMKGKYEQMLGRKDIEVIHNGAEDICFDMTSPNLPPFSKQNPFKFCFLGGLFDYLHGECVEDIFTAIHEVRKKYEWVRFDLFGQKQPDNFLNDVFLQEGIIHHGIVMPLEKKFEIMEQSHCFIIPSSFNSNKNKYYKYSFPTKLPELIASSRPILSYGPVDTSTNQFLHKHNIGVRIYNRSIQDLIDGLLDLIDNYSQKLEEAKFARNIAKKKLSAHGIRTKLYNFIGTR